MQNQWYKDAVIYQIYPRSFCDSNGDGIGDIEGIISKIDHLKSLGIDAIWFSPLYCSPNHDYGYDISDYCNIHPEYGTMEQFDTMLKLLHENNIRVIMDLVVNHTSDKHKWFIEASKSEDNPYRDYYIWGKGKGKRPPNNWTSFFLGSAWQYQQQTDSYYLHLFDKAQPDLNYSNPKVIEEVKNILKFWLDKGVDGFRCDVITLLDKTDGLPNGKPAVAIQGNEHFIDGPRMYSILEQFQTVLKEYDAFTVGESVWINPQTALKYTTEGKAVLDTVFAFDHLCADCYLGVKQFVRKFSLRRLRHTLNNWQQQLKGKSWNSLFFENHDQARTVGRYCDDSQYRVEGAKMIATLLMTMCGTPYVYQGQEIGMTSIRMTDITKYQDVESVQSYNTLKKFFGKKKAMKNIAYCSRDNARTPMQWSNGHMAGFTSGESSWLSINENYTTVNVEDSKEGSVLEYYKHLIKLRHQTELWRYGSYEDLDIKNNNVLSYKRTHDGQEMIVLLNFSTKTINYKLKENIEGSYTIMTSNYTDSANLGKTVTLRPHEAIVYVKQ